jgi:GNAT superfamily N-acetyltransferase
MERLADIAITPAGPGDAAALGEVHVATWRQTYPGLLPQTYLTAMNPHLHARRWRHQLTRARSGEVVLVAEGPRGLIGYCAGALAAREAEPSEGDVFTLYLIQSAQGMGFGRRLLASMARVLAAQGAASLRLWVLNGNHSARGFYAHMGGRPSEERAVSGWGGGLKETAYRWDDIRTVADQG